MIITGMFDKQGSFSHKNQRSHYSVTCHSFVPLNTIPEHADASMPSCDNFQNSSATIHKQPFPFHNYCKSAARNQFLHSCCIHICLCAGQFGTTTIIIIIMGIQSTIYKLSASPADMQHSMTTWFSTHLSELAVNFNE